MKKIFFLAIIISSNVFAAFEMNDNMQKSYLHIINLEFEKGIGFLEKERIENPNNGFIPLHQNYIDFLTILIGEERDYFEAAKQYKTERLDILERNDKNSPYYLYSQAELHLQWAFTRIKFEQYSIAVYEFIKANNLLEENKERFPEFTLNNKGLGLIHVLLGAVPEKYHWLLNLGGLEGSIDLGFLELENVLNDNFCSMYENEVLFLISFLQMNLRNDDLLSKKYLARIGDRCYENILLNFAAARLSHNLGQNDNCLNILENRPYSTAMFPFHYLDYLQGMAYIYKLDYDSAKQKFESFTANFNGINYIKSAYHKLAWIAYLTGKENVYFNRVIKEGNVSIDEDKVALRDAQRNYITHSRLLIARLLYDGGYYEEALLELSVFKSISESFMYLDEYWYRSAKIKLKLDYNDDEIINDFEKSYDFGKNTENYYAPNSALIIGLIYERKRKNKQAKLYFNQCLSMSNFDYERGIHQQAKSALNRIAD